MAGRRIGGGVLMARAVSPFVDPLASRLAGGVPVNAMGGRPGVVLGTEVDLGVRYRVHLAGTELTLGLEGGVLWPGSAFVAPGGALPPPLVGGRGLLRYRL